MANFKAFLLLGLVLAHVALVISEVSARELEETEVANGEQLDGHGQGHGHEHRHDHERHDHEHHGKPGHDHPGHGAAGGGV